MNKSEPLTVLVADDHPIFVKGLRTVLEQVPSLQVVAEAHDGVSAWQRIQDLRPNVAILDLEMPDMDGLQVARRVVRHEIPVRLIILTLHKDESLLRQAMEIGVLGYLLKEDATADLVQCIKSVIAGRHFIAPALSSYLVRSSQASNDPVTSRLDGLSRSQREVLKLIGQGLTSKEIGAELGISYRTVENHRFRIVEKLGLKGSNSLLRFALENKEKL